MARKGPIESTPTDEAIHASIAQAAQVKIGAIRRFFERDFPDEVAAQFVAAALTRFQTSQDVDDAIEFAIDNTDPRFNFPVGAFADAVEAVPQVLQDNRQLLFNRPMPAGGIADLALDTADAALGLRIQGFDIAQDALYVALCDAIPKADPYELPRTLTAWALPLSPIQIPPNGDIAFNTDANVSEDGGEAEAPGTIQTFIQNNPKLTAIVEIVLSTLGVGNIFEAVTTDGLLKPLFEILVDAIRTRDAARAERAIHSILQRVTSKAFLKSLAKKIGKKGAAKVLGKILTRTLPIVGWLLLIGTLIYEIYRNFDKLADP